jgi:phosphoribosylglycinamide formyltransferase-1
VPTPKLPIVVLISGSGSNLQALIDAIACGELNAEIRAVISNRPDAKGLQRARDAGIPTEVLDHTRFESREAFDQALQQRIDSFEPRLVVLAGFMRLLTDNFVDHYLGRMLNIHPSLLPAYTGLNTHQRVLDAGEPRHGASVHFVTAELDGGPLILQATVDVQPDETPTSLAARVLEKEHKIYPLAVQWFAEGRLQLLDHHAWFDGKVLTQPLQYETLPAGTGGAS